MSFGFSVGDFLAVIQLANKVRRDFAGAPAQFLSIKNNVRHLAIVLQDADVTLSDSDVSQRQRAELEAILGGCRAILSDLENVRDRYSRLGAASSSLDNRTRRAWQRLKWESDDAREFQDRMTKSITLLNTFICSLTSRATFDVKKLAKDLSHRAETQDRLDILNWLSPLDPAMQQNDFLRRRQEGTCEWFITATQYEAWLRDRGAVLYCPGIPGSGKTIVASVVIDNLINRFHASPSVGVAYIYFDFRSHATQKPDKLLASLLKQLLERQQNIPEALAVLHRRWRNVKTEPTIKELLTSLQLVLNSLMRAFIVIDALDECQTSDGCRSAFLSILLSLQSSHKINVLATSRFTPDMSELFVGHETLEILARDGDVQTYIAENISQLPRFVARNESLKQHIITKIVESIDGMFLLAQLHLDSLRGKKSPKAIRAALDRIVTGSDAYDGAYGDAMHRIGCQLPDEGGLAKQALMWITLVKRPLTTTELQHALAVEIGLSKLDEDNVSQIEDIVSVCAGLVTVDKERNLVRLVHYTTQEYFERNRDRWFPEAEAIITDTCVTYLSFDAFGSGICATDEEFKERMDTYALYRYATKEWGDHARAVTTLSQATKDFLAPSKSLDAAVEAFTAVEVPFPKGFLRTGHEGLTGLHLAAWFGKEELVRHAAGFCDVNARTSYGTTALEFAAVRGHRAVVEILISRDAHVHGKRKVGQSAISLAAEGGFKDIVEILLEHGADIASVDRFDRTPLLLAARRGHTDIVRLLLEKGSDVEWIDDSQGRTSLAHAARGGYNSTAEALIASGAKVEAKDFDGMTALGLAVEGGYSSTLEMLLSKGADIEALDHGRDHASRSALMRMISRQNREAVELLIRHGANIELRTEAGFTPLMLATRLGNEGIVKLLLDSGCDIDAKDKDEKTALHLAIESGRGNIVALLRAGLDGD